MDHLTKEQRHKNMAAIKGTGSKIELLLGKLMWHSGVRYRKNDKKVYGHPDFVMKGRKLAIFCDGDMWHGRDWENRKSDFKSNQDFWFAKIERNMARDREVNEKLMSEGWTILRFWGTDILKHPEDCLKKILQVYNAK